MHFSAVRPVGALWINPTCLSNPFGNQAIPRTLWCVTGFLAVTSSCPIIFLPCTIILISISLFYNQVRLCSGLFTKANRSRNRVNVNCIPLNDCSVTFALRLQVSKKQIKRTKNTHQFSKQLPLSVKQILLYSCGGVIVLGADHRVPKQQLPSVTSVDESICNVHNRDHDFFARQCIVARTTSGCQFRIDNTLMNEFLRRCIYKDKFFH